MALVNQAKREINAKIVFFGPGLAGKATSLKHVFNKLKPEFRGAMKVMNVQDARMLFFDFTPPGDGNVDGFRVRFHLYTVSGGNVDPAAWKMVLKGVDGVVFVADSSKDRLEDNKEAMENLAAFLKGYGQSLASVPAVLQVNKSDLAEALPVAELDRAVNAARIPTFSSSAKGGEGVLQALMALVKTVLTGLRAKGTEGIAGADALQQVVDIPVTPAAPVAPRQQSPAEAAPVAPTMAFQVADAPMESAAPAPTQEALTLEISGTPTAGKDGVVSVPLTIRSGSVQKQVMLNLSLSLDRG